MNNQPKYLSYLHSFRGFAIINIVFIHAFAFAFFDFNNMSMDLENPYVMANELIFHNSTIYFAVISGLLFSVVLKDKGYKRFYRSKFKNVLLPYLFLTLLFSLYTAQPDNPFVLRTDFSLYLNDAFYNFITGKAMFQFWYIPVLIFIFLLTPFVHYLMIIKKWGTFLILLIIFLPLVISRLELADTTDQDYVSISNIIYFMGAYSAGMYFGVKPEAHFNWVKKNMVWFIIVAILSSLAILYFKIIKIDKLGFWSLNSTLFYIQKMSLAAIVIVLFKNLGEKQPRWLVPLANNAFSIYFLHAYFLFMAFRVLMPITTWHQIAPFNLFISALCFLILSIGLSLIVTWLVKKTAGKYSRMLIGS
jgi:surface polysaccharide O-acyltransferase-like enzyme